MTNNEKLFQSVYSYFAAVDAEEPSTQQLEAMRVAWLNVSREKLAPELHIHRTRRARRKEYAGSLRELAWTEHEPGALKHVRARLGLGMNSISEWLGLTKAESDQLAAITHDRYGQGYAHKLASCIESFEVS